MTNSSTAEINPLAGLAAFVFPGAGHLLLGRPKRAALICVGVMGLFLFGLLIGGIDAIDHRDHKVWFIGEALVGLPTIAVDAVHQSKYKAYDLNTSTLRAGYPGEQRVVENGRAVWKPLSDQEISAGLGPPNVPGLGRINEIAMLSIVLAGMLNLIVFLDALMPTPEPAKKNAARNPPTPPAGGEGPS